jgi:hypothetical protein
MTNYLGNNNNKMTEILKEDSMKNTRIEGGEKNIHFNNINGKLTSSVYALSPYNSSKNLNNKK